jgi:hypothetical protein
MQKFGFTFMLKLMGDYKPIEIDKWINNADITCYVSCDEGISIMAFDDEDTAMSFRMKFDSVVDNDTEFLGVKYEKVKEARTAS